MKTINKLAVSLGRKIFGNWPKKGVYELGRDKITYDPDDTIILKARHGFGDNLMVTAVIEGIHQQCPDLRIIVCAKHPDIFAHNPHIVSCHNINEIDKRHPLLKKATDMEYMSYEKQKRKTNQKSHMIDNLYNCLPMNIQLRCYKPRLFLTEQELSYKRQIIESLMRPLVAIVPYGKKKSPLPGKIYPPEQWNEIVKLLVDSGCNVLQVGTESEGPLISGALDWRDIGFKKTCVVLSHCDTVITHPGGFMHSAVALDVPCAVLYGGIEDPDISGYPQNENICVSLDCAPCWRKKLCKKPYCLEEMTPNLIVNRVLAIINLHQ